MEYLSDFVCGSIDGTISSITTITTAAGASLSP